MMRSARRCWPARLMRKPADMPMGMPTGMTVIGLTGGMGAGKSTAACMMRRMGIPVFDADAAVHRLQAAGGAALPAIAARFPQAVRQDSAAGHARWVLDRPVLRRIVSTSPDALSVLEAIMHPLLMRQARNFLHQARRRQKRHVVLDVPLLFEAGWDRLCDAVIVVTAPPPVQIARIRARCAMSAEEVRALLRRQMPDQERRRRADHVIRTGLNRHETRRQLLSVLRKMKAHD
ncbi:Dephospho-CoA kinase [Granulibacter bethesdensis CGDNIH1]|uniref:Dephospho-CoA kinase n=2 Tax=Granulibacter bethesdensis TaxID=364410 RepID=Q0BQ61_GRABC|nr:Dephospho-CoA kinase [Granulibacter bethesdensis CGDNIH1]APH52914.1 Dephospho-CoA kinase [Granulibacter bethesdensis]APH65602.1 Dephospho-CoA kinase [Granulibacter bethesdensis]